MDVGQSPIQFIDHQPIGGHSRTPTSSYYNNTNVGALSNRLHQLRPAGSIPFSSRTNPGSLGMSSTMPRQQQQQQKQSQQMGYDYDAANMMMMQYNTLQPSSKSLSSQNLANLSATPYRSAIQDPMAANVLNSTLMMTSADRPRPSSARDPNWILYDPIYGSTRAIPPPPPPQPNKNPSQANRFRQNRSSSFDQERDPRIVAPSQPNPVLDYSSTNDYLLDPYQPQPSLDPTSYSLQRELSRMQQELDLTKDKLASSLNSIKTFWSPELKRERALRKDENSKYVLLAEELHQIHMEKKSMLSNIHQLETDLRREKELRSKHSQSAQELDLLYRRCEELEKENRILSKQSEESDKRAQFQKESLATAEENIRKLLEVVKATKSGNPVALQGLKLDRFEENQIEIERLRAHVQEYSNRTLEMERNIVDRDFEINRNKEQLDMLTQENQSLRQENENIHQDIQQTQTLQSLVDTKESKILTLENEMRLLEDELARMRDEELITPTTSMNGAMDEFEKALRNPSANIRPHDRLLKSKMEAMTVEISKRDSEVYSLQSRLEMAEKQHQDQNHHINVLKEQVKTREHKISMLMADVEDFRKRLKEKETLLEKKSQILTCSQSEKHQTESEIIEWKDQCEMKDKKISLLQRKVENLEDLLNDKENQLSNAKSKLTTLHSDYTNTEGTKVNLEEMLREKERQIERIKEAKARMEHEYQDELEMQKKQISETKSKLENSERELREKVAMLNEVREELSELRAAKFKRDSENNTLQVQLSQRASEVAALQLEIQTVKKQYISDTEYKSNHRIAELESQVNHYSESATRLQGEVDRLLNLARNLENEKLDKDRQIHQLESQIKELQLKVNNTLRSHQNDKDFLSEEVETLKRKEDNILADMEVVKSSLSEREGRIKELEQALRESVKLSAERENYLHSQEDSCRQLEIQVTDQKQSLEMVQKERNNLSQQLITAQDDLRERENQLKTIESECFKNYIPELDRQRKSNQELILRVQALVKLVQGREFQLSDQERNSLGELGLYPDSFNQRGYPATGRVSAVPYSSYSKNVSWSLQPSGMGGSGLYHSGSGLLPHSNSMLLGNVGGSNYLPTTMPPSMQHHSGSAFHSTMTHSDDVSKLSRLLHEKEQMLHQQIEDMSRLRLQNSELESRLKGMEERLGSSSSFYTSKFSGTTDIMSLRQMNTELSSKVTYLKTLLEEKDEKLKSLSNESRTNFLQMEIERIKREMNTTISEKDNHISLLAGEVDKFKKEKNDINETLLKVHGEMKEKNDKIIALESEHSRFQLEKESLQKKYQTALTHLSEKTDKIENLERECYQKQQDEIKRLKLENEENSHRLSFMQKSLSDRDSRVEQLEKDHYKFRDEMSSIQKQHHNAECEVKRLKDELSYREQRIKQIQISHTEELNQLRSSTQEANARMSQIRQSMEEKDQMLKNKVQEIEKWKTECEMSKRKLRDKETDITRFTNDLSEKETTIKSLERDYNDEVQRYQKANEDATSRVNLMQKRVEERESRMKKIELENNELLDEIHTLRKRNHEMESQLDILKQQVLDKDGVNMPLTNRSSSTMDMGYYSSQTSHHHQSAASMVGPASSIELDQLRKQYQEAMSANVQLQKTSNEATLQNDRLSMDRDFLTKKLEDLTEQHNQLKKKYSHIDEELKTKEIELLKRGADETTKFSMQKSEMIQEKKDLLQELENREIQISELSRELENLQHQKLELDNNYQSQNIQLKEMQSYIEQLVRERDDARVIASSTTGYGNSSYRMNIQDQQRIMQQQIDKANTDLERSQKENHELRTRVQEVSRQLKETQNNWDCAVRERDMFKQQAQNKSRETQISQLSKEMERLHKTEEENTRKLEESQRQTNEAKRELEKIKRECQEKMEANKMEHQKALRDLEKLQGDLRDQQEQNERREEEISNSQQEESEKLKHQYSAMSKKFITLQHEFETKERQIQQLTETLDQIRRENNELQTAVDDLHNRNQQLEYDTSNNQMEKDQLMSDKKELEGWVGQMKDALNSKGNEIASLQQTRRKSVEIQQMNMQNQIGELTEQLELKDKQLDEVNRQLENAAQEIQEQEYMIQELSQKLDTIQYSDELGGGGGVRKSTVATNTMPQQQPQQQQQLGYNSGPRNSQQYPNNTEEMDRLRSELANTKRLLQEKDQRVQLLEVECFQQQADEIERLRKELKSVNSNQSMDSRRSSQNNPQTMSHSYSNNDVQFLKMEVDNLKKEVNAKNDQLEKHERECQEKHLRRIDALQLKLKRTEEELVQMERQIEDMKHNLEERDRMLKQVKMSQHQATSVELEKLREEYGRCQDELNIRNSQIKTLEKQINSQIKEILEIKQEALTASICEKDANIALLQMTGANNNHAQQALQKMMNEKSQLQSQLKQLSSTRQKLQEEQNK